MMDPFHPMRFIVCERFKFWSKMDRKPGETINELVARIRQDAVTCNFTSITDPLDEAMRTRFICSLNNEAVLRALFKVKDDDLTFARAVEMQLKSKTQLKLPRKRFTVNFKQEINKIQPKKKREVFFA